jgi:hypothetical protein
MLGASSEPRGASSADNNFVELSTVNRMTSEPSSGMVVVNARRISPNNCFRPSLSQISGISSHLTFPPAKPLSFVNGNTYRQGSAACRGAAAGDIEGISVPCSHTAISVCGSVKPMVNSAGSKLSISPEITLGTQINGG